MRRPAPTRERARLTPAVVVALLLTGACSDAPAPADPASAEDAVAEDAVASTEAEVEDAAPSADDEPAAAVDVAVEEAGPRLDLGLPGVELTTPGSGEGPWPSLAWEPVAGAETYVVTVYAPDGRAYWAWSGTAASVIVGDHDTTPTEDDGGPRVRDGMMWDVVAVDEQGDLVAQSGVRPIAP